jgi:transcriptional regulator with XRE-family HTH domain
MDELRRIRKERGLSQQRLAELAKVDKVTIVHIEGGKVSPKVETLEKLATALEVEVADFFPKAQAPLPEMQDYGALLEERGFPREQIVAWLAQDESDKEFIARELERMSAKDVLEQIIATNPRLRKYYREHPPRADAPARSESA